MSATVNLTDRLAASLPVPTKPTYYRDAQHKGLQLAVQPTGTRTWYFSRAIRGKPVRIRLGTTQELTVAQARQLAAKHGAAISSGEDPRWRRKGDPTLGDLFDHWIADATPRKKAASVKRDQRQFDMHLARWKSRSLRTIGRPDVAALHAKVGKKHGKYAANRLLSLLSAMFGIADDLGYSGRNPCKRVHRFHEESRDRFLGRDELSKFLGALQAESLDFQHWVKLCLYTGARKSNVNSMAWKDIDWENKTWRIPLSKNGEPVVVPLIPQALGVLTERLGMVRSDGYVFPATRPTNVCPTNQGACHNLSGTGFTVNRKAAWKRTLKRAGIENLRPHDLRRTLASLQAINGTPLLTIAKSLGHRGTNTTPVYARLDVEVVRHSMAAAAGGMESQ